MVNFAFIEQSIRQRQQQQLYRQRQQITSTDGRFIQVGQRQYLNFSSNDYLGLAHHPQLIAAWSAAARHYGVGSSASPLITGYLAPHYQLESLLAEWLQLPAVLLFSSGYGANQGVIQALASPETLLLQDKRNHASLIEAGMNSGALMRRFIHNDVEALRRLLAGSYAEKDKLVITEGIFSMDGDAAPLSAIYQVCQTHQSWLMVDDAHGLGVVGPQGKGSLFAQSAKADIYMATFGKALGVAGAFVAASFDVIDYLVNFCRHYLYSTSMPAAQASAVIAAIHLLRTEALNEQLQQRIHYFRQLLVNSAVQLQPSTTAIQPWCVGSVQQAEQCSRFLREKGMWVTAIRPPTVPNKQARLRITLSVNHQLTDLEQLAEELMTCQTKCRVWMNNE